MERVIHHFPVQDDSQVSLVIVEQGDGPRIEWRRQRVQADGTAILEECFTIRLAWIPALMEALQRAEESFREIQREFEVELSGPSDNAAEVNGRVLTTLPEGGPSSPPEEAEAFAEFDQPFPAIRSSGRFPRFVIRAPIIVAAQNKDIAGPRVLTGDAVDISWGGLQAHLPARLQPGTEVEILLGLGGQKALKLPARVVWARPGFGPDQPKAHALEFLPTDQRLRQLFERYLILLSQGTRTEV